MFISKKKLKELQDSEFNHGIDVGKSLGAYEVEEEAREAYAEGKIEWWIEKVRPKTIEEWEEWEKQNGPV